MFDREIDSLGSVCMESNFFDCYVGSSFSKTVDRLVCSHLCGKCFLCV